MTPRTKSRAALPLLRSYSPHFGRLNMMVGDAHLDNAIVSVLDGHSFALCFLGGALGAELRPLGADRFGQSGLPHEVYDAL